MADWGRINGFPFIGSSSPIAPYNRFAPNNKKCVQYESRFFLRAKLEALKTLSFGRLSRFQFAGMNMT